VIKWLSGDRLPMWLIFAIAVALWDLAFSPIGSNFLPTVFTASCFYLRSWSMTREHGAAGLEESGQAAARRVLA